MSKSKLLLALLSGLALPMGAYAADPGEKPVGEKPAAATPAPGTGGAASSMFQQLDADGDGYITAKESEKSATAKANFKAMDKNRDGKLSPDEWKAGGGS